MTIFIAAITAFMFYLGAHPAALAIGLAATAWALALDTRAALIDRHRR